MGFFSLSAKCAICDREVGLNRYKIGTTIDGEIMWKCPQCARKGGLLYIDRVTGRATIGNPEFRKKCNVCGRVYCFTFKDLAQNHERAKSAALSSIAGLGATVGGAYAAGAVNQANAQHSLDGIVDYDRCPHCGSADVRELSESEWTSEQASLETSQSSTTVSTADELKKFKELLDSGAITQEEYDAKKKQLLSL